MTVDARVGQLVERWQSLQARGEDTSVEDLCRDCPELLDDLRRALHEPSDAGSEVDTARTSMPEAGAEAIASGDATEGLFDFFDPPRGPGEIGRLGPYQVIRLIGSGGMGSVFHAIDEQL